MIKGFRSALQNIYFRRLLISFIAITLLISCLCGAILLKKGSQTLANEFYRGGQNQLNDVRTYMENTYLNNFKNIFISDVLSIISPDSSDDLLYSLYNKTDTNLYQIFRLVNHLKTAVVANKGTDNISIYFNKIGYMVDQDSFYQVSENSSKHALLANLNTLPINRWFLQKLQYDGTFEEQILTYVYTFPFNADRDRIDGYLFIDLQINQVRQILNAQLDNPVDKLFMYNYKDKSMIGSSNISPQELISLQYKLEANPLGGRESDGTYFSFLPAADYNHDWAFAAIRPAAAYSSALFQMRLQIFLICLGILIVGLTLSYYLSYKSYQPVRLMLIKLREINSSLFPSQQQNEFKIFDHVLSGLNTTIKQLTHQVDGNKLHALLNGHLMTDELPANLLVHYRYLVVKVKLYRGNKEQWFSRFRHIPAPFPYEMVDINASEFNILYYAVDGENASQRIVEYLAMNMVMEEGADKGTFAAGIGGEVGNAEGIQKSNDQAQLALKYVFIRDGHPIIEYNEICLRTQMPAINYEPYEQALRAGNLQAVEQFIDEFERVMKQSQFPLEAIELSLLQMTVTMSKVMIDINNKERLFSSSSLFQDLKQETFERTIYGIREQSNQIAKHIQQHLLHNIQYDVIYKLKTYIDTHLQEDISLDRLSELAVLSPQYISKQFKDVLHVSFVEYLTNARMERACELLSGNNSSVTDIATQVGFNNVQYFCAKFKHKHGVTPIQFRKSFKKASIEAAGGASDG